MTVEAAQPEPEEYDVFVNAWGNDVGIGTYEVGYEVDDEIYDANYGNIVSVIPSNLQYTLNGQVLTFTMPDEQVTFTSELPQPGTGFDFVGYEHDDDENAYTTGMLSYNWIDTNNSTYITGDLWYTPPGADEDSSKTVYISRSDAPNMMDGQRIPVYVMDANDQLVVFCYGEFTMQ